MLQNVDQPCLLLPASARRKADGVISSQGHDYQRFAAEVRKLCGKRDELLNTLREAFATPSQDDDAAAKTALRGFARHIKRSLHAALDREEPHSMTSTLLAEFYAKLWTEVTLAHSSSDANKLKQLRFGDYARRILSVCSVIQSTASQVLAESIVSGVQIVELDGESSKSIRDFAPILGAINAELTIQLDRREPQNGFERTIGAEEMRELLSHAGARLFLLELGGNVVGYYLVFLDSKCPPRVKRAFEHCRENGLKFDNGSTAWGFIVGITPQMRAICADLGVNAYDLLHEAVLDSMRTQGINKMYAVVREGEYANPAKARHVEKRWRETGVMTSRGDFPFQTLELEVPQWDGLALPNRYGPASVLRK